MSINAQSKIATMPVDNSGNVLAPVSKLKLSSFVNRDSVLTIAPFIVAAIILSVIAQQVINWWGWEYTAPESYYSHGPIIPFMSMFMLWAWRDRLKTIEYKLDPLALLLLIPSLAVLVIAIKFEMRSIESISFIGTIWGCFWFALGRAFVRVAWFPLFFLALMMPLPGPVLNDATLSLQSTSTGLASKILNSITFTNERQGNLIVMNNFTLFVDVPCSGFKTLLALFTFNAFLAAMLDGPLAKRLLLFILCAPMALIINAVRITLIGIVGECVGTTAAHIFHDYSGLLMLTLGFFVLFSVARLLGCKKFAGLAIFS